AKGDGISALFNDKEVDTPTEGIIHNELDSPLSCDDKHVVCQDRNREEGDHNEMPSFQGNAGDNGGADEHRSLGKAIPSVRMSLKIIVAFFLHFLGRMKRSLPIKSDEVCASGNSLQQPLNAPYLCNMDSGIYDRVAKLEELMHKMGAATPMPPTNCNFDEMSPAQIQILEVELAETKKTLHAVLSRQSEIQESLKRLEERKTRMHCW
ncbi:hypothetical protein GOP47_0017860, partial [Adiantum capillus-veneris]